MRAVIASNGRRRPSRALLTALAVACGLASSSGSCTPEPANGPRRARPRLSPRQAVDLEFRTLDGASLRLAQFRGRPLVLFFFATWCVPCQVQLARLQPVRAALGNDRVAVVGVALDRQRRLVPTFVDAAGIAFPVVYGDPSMVRDSPLGAVRGVPRLLILDARGRPRADFHRPVDGRVLMRTLRPLVEEAGK